MALVGKAYVEIHAITDAVNKEIKDGLDKGMQGEGTKVGDTFSKEFDKSLKDNTKTSIKQLSDDFEKQFDKAGDSSGKSFSDKFSAAFSKTVSTLGTKLRDAVTVDANTAPLEAKLAAAKKNLDDLSRQRANPQIDLDIRALEINQKVAMDKLHELALQHPSPEVNVQIDKALLNIDQLARKVDDLKAKRATIDFDADVAKAEAEIAGLEAEIDRVDGRKIRVDTSGMTKSFSESLVGANMLMRALSAFALPLAIIAATPYIASIGYAAVQASAGVFLLPAAIGAAGLAMITFKVATAGVGKALGDAFDPAKAKAFQKDLAALTPPAREFVLAVQTMGPALNALKTSTADAFFANMGTQVKLLGSNFMPTLSGAMTTVAGSFNSAFVSTMQWMNSAMGITTVNTFLVSCAQVVHNLVTALGPVIQAFISIGAIAGPILAQLTDSVGSVAARFATWTQSAQGVQTITRWIYEALNVLGNLYLLTRNVGSILMSAFGAGNAAVGDFLQTLVDATGKLAAFFKTPAGSQALHDVFATIATVVGNLWEKLVILWPAIEAAARAIGSLLQASGPLSNLLLTGLVPALTAFLNLINWLAPVLGPLATTYFTISVAMGAWNAAAKVAAAAQIAFNGATYGGAVAQKEFAVAAGISKVGMLAGAAASYIWAAAQWVVNAAMTTFVGLEYASGIGEIVAVILVIIAVIAALAFGIYELITHWSQVWSFLKETWSQLVEIVKTAWNAVIGFLTGLPATIANLATSAWDGLVSATTTAFDAVVGFITSLPGRIASVASTLWEGLVSGTKAAFDAVVGFIVNLPNTLRQMAYDAGAALAEFVTWAVNTAIAFKDAFVNGFNAVVAWVSALPGRITAALLTLGVQLYAIAITAWTSFTNGVTTAWNATVAFVEGIPAWFTSTLSALGTWLYNTATTAWNAFTSGVTTAWNATAAWFSALPGRIVSFVMGIGPWLATVASDAWNGFTTGFTTAWNATVAWLESVPGMIGNFFSSAGTWLWQTGSDLISGLWNGIVAAWNGFWGFIGSLIDSFLSGFKDHLGVHSPSTIFMEIGGDLIQGLINGVQAMWAALLGILTTIATGIITAFSGLWNGIVTVATTVWGWIVTFFQNEMTGLVNIWTFIWTTVSTVFTTVWAVISGAISAGLMFIQGVWNAVWGAVAGFFQQVWAGIQLEVQVAWMYIQMLIQTGIYYVQAIWTAVWGAISGFFTQVWVGMQAQFAALWAAISGAISAGLAFVQGLWTAVWGAISSFFVSIWVGIQNAAITIWNAISSFLIAGINAYNAFWGAVWNAIANFFRAVWAGIQNAAITIWNAIAAFFSGAFAAFTGMFNAVWNAISAAFSAIWNAMRAAVTGIWNAISAFFSGAFSAFQGLVSATFNNVSRVITDVWNGIKGTTQAIWDGIVNVVKGAVNGVVDAANWMVGGVNKVLGFLSIPQIPGIPRLEKGGIVGLAQGGNLADIAAAAGAFPAAAAGTRVGSGFTTKGPQVLVGEGRANYPEFVIPTDPQHRRRALQLTAMLAKTITPAPQQDRLSPGARPTTRSSARATNGAMPALAGGGILGGIGDAIGAVSGGIGDLGSWLMGSVEALTKTVGDGINGLIPKSLFSGAGTKVASEVVPAVWKKIQDSLATLGGGGNWTPVMAAALAMTGQAQSNVAPGIRRLNQESGGNPLAVNRTDINWQHGTPSVGLMQVIGPTYASNKDPRRDVGPYMYGTSVDPLSNILASIHYTIGRYGSVTAGWNKAGGYDNGGWLHPGIHAINESGVPEAVIPDPARTLTNAITRAIGSLPERCEVALVRGAQAGYNTIAPAIQGIYSGMYSAARSPWQAATAATTLIHNVGEMLHSGSTSADRNGQIAQPVAKAVSTAITNAPKPVITAPPALTTAAASTGNIVTDFKSSMLGVFREFAPQLTLAMQAGNKDQINQLATKLMNDPQQSAQFKSAIQSVYQQFTPAITAAANSAIDTKVQTATTASSAAIDAYFKQFSVHTTPGTAATAAVTKTVVTPMAQAAQQALDALKSGKQFFEDFSYRGMSNNSVLAQYNDTLADGFYKNGQQFDPKDPNMMAKLTSYLQNTINSGTNRVTTPGTAGTPGTTTVGTIDDGVAAVESKMRAALSMMSRSFVSNFAKSAPDVYNAIQSAAPDLDDVLKTKSGALASFLGTQQKSDVDTFISSMGGGPTTLDSLLSLGSAVTSSNSTSSENASTLNFHNGAFSVTINGNADQVTVQQLNDTLTNWSEDLIRYVQQGG